MKNKKPRNFISGKTIPHVHSVMARSTKKECKIQENLKLKTPQIRIILWLKFLLCVQLCIAILVTM